jgi:hypothetical protein
MKPVLIFDEIVCSAAIYSTPEFNRYLGTYDKYSFHMVCSPGVGTLGTMAFRLEHGSDERNWADKNAASEFTTAPTVSATAQASAIGADNGAVASQGFGRVRVTHSTSGQCRVKIYATGRMA